MQISCNPLLTKRKTSTKELNNERERSVNIPCIVFEKVKIQFKVGMTNVPIWIQIKEVKRLEIKTAIAVFRQLSELHATSIFSNLHQRNITKENGFDNFPVNYARILELFFKNVTHKKDTYDKLLYLNPFSSALRA